MKTRKTAYPIWNRLQLAKDGHLSLREQLLLFLRKGIADGNVKAGIRLPASRVLATQLGLSRMTVTEAYGQLIAEGFLEARTGSGTYVMARIAEQTASPPARTEAPVGSTRARALTGTDSMSVARAAWPLTPACRRWTPFPMRCGGAWKAASGDAGHFPTCPTATRRVFCHCAKPWRRTSARHAEWCARPVTS